MYCLRNVGFLQNFQVVLLAFLGLVGLSGFCNSGLLGISALLLLGLRFVGQLLYEGRRESPAERAALHQRLRRAFVCPKPETP